jgi:tetratricopeptide (TPR) repeat protein
MGRILSGGPGIGAGIKTTGDLFATFGEFLRYLRRRERLTQTELGIASGYSAQHIHLLETGQRLPDPSTVAALFVPALHLENRSDTATRLVELAAAARAMSPSHGRRTNVTGEVTVQRGVTRIETVEEVGTLEDPPSTPPLLVERSGALERLQERLASERCIALCGLPGMGKSTLAAALARLHDGPVLWLTFTEGVNTSADAVVRQLALFAIANDLAPTAMASQLMGRAPSSPALPLDQQIALLSRALAGRASSDALLCFDNADLILGDDTVRHLLERLVATSRAYFLFVSREDMPLAGLAHMQLDGLEMDEASELMRRLLSDERRKTMDHGRTTIVHGPSFASSGPIVGEAPAGALDEQTRPDNELLDRLYERTAGSPMLLRLSVGEMADHHLDMPTFVQQLASQPHISPYVLDTIIKRLSPTALRVALLVAIFRQPLDLYDPALTELMLKGKLLADESSESPHRRTIDDSSDPSFTSSGPVVHPSQAQDPSSAKPSSIVGEALARALDELQHRHVLDNPSRAALHPLVSGHLARISAGDPGRLREMHLLAARYEDRHLGNVVEAGYHYCQAGKLNEMADVLADRGMELFNRGAGQAALEVVDQGLGQVRRKRNPPPGLLRRLLAIRGDLLASGLRAGEAEANYREALALALQDGSPTAVQAQTMFRLASCLSQRSQAPEALDICRRALALLGHERQRGADTLLAAQLVMAESGALAMLGRLDEAEASGTRALELSDGLMTTLPGMALGIRARSRNVLGMVSAMRQQHDDALHHWSSAIDAARQVDMVQLEYRCRGNMGNVFYEKGDLERATRYCAEAVAALQTMGDEYGAVRFMNTLANAQFMRFQLDDAIQTLEQACEIKQRMGDRSGLAISLATQGVALLAQGHSAQARAHIEDALRALKETEAMRVRGYVLMMTCDTQLAAGDVAGARATLREAEELSGAEADAKWSADLQNHRALTMLAAGEIEAASAAVAEDAPPEAGTEVGMMRAIVRGAVAFARGDRDPASAAFSRIEEEGRDKGFLLFATTALRLNDAVGSDLAPTDMVRLVYY